jgi:hypothetical protein
MGTRRVRDPAQGRPGASVPQRAARVAALLVALLTAVASGPAQGSPRTLRRSLGSILFAPVDLALSPIVATRGIARSLKATQDPTAVRVGFAVPGVAWNTGVQALAAVVREISGLLEFPAGLCLLAFEADLEPLYAPSERGEALVDVQTPALRIRFGINYLNPPR